MVAPARTLTPGGGFSEMQTHHGYIKALKIEKGFGFISVHGSPDVFFNVREIDDSLTWDETLQERRVQFRIVTTGRGLKAVDVRAAD